MQMSLDVGYVEKRTVRSTDICCFSIFNDLDKYQSIN